MILFFTTFGLCLVVALLFFVILKTISVKELLCIVAVEACIALIASFICYHVATEDVQILNSTVASKQQVQVNCEHSYSCNCHEECSGYGKNKSCYQHCDTCYEHTHDWDWRVSTAVGNYFNIERIDRQGNREPPRYTSTLIGEPTVTPESYTNYIKASPDSLFLSTGQVDEKKLATVPEYPSAIYDYWHLQRLVRVGVGLPNAEVYTWNSQLEALNGRIGSKKQVNAIVVLAQNKPPEWFYSLRQKWLGGKKNDVVLVIGVDSEMKPLWANTMSWENNQLFQVKLIDAVSHQSIVDSQTTLNNLEQNILQFHQRKPMADFKYLEASITPTLTGWIVTMLIEALVLAGLLYLFNQDEFFT